jgi:hypothetical protein
MLGFVADMHDEFLVQEPKNGQTRPAVKLFGLGKGIDSGADLPFTQVILADEIQRAGQKPDVGGLVAGAAQR